MGLAVLALAAFAATPSAAAVRAVSVGHFDHPTYVDNAPGYPRLLFVVEQAGRIEVLDDENPAGRPFLDITSIVRGPPDGDAGGEEGLLSLAFAPDYPSSGRFYVSFVNRAGNVEVDEFQRSAASPTRADRSSRRGVIVIRRPASQYHAGGQLQFGPDDLLYLGTGDGGKPANGPALTNLLGKLIRIDPRPAGGDAYQVPSSNPYVGREGRDEIFAYGFRNPWRFAFDGATLAIGDVGQDVSEEIDLLLKSSFAGANFGWPEYEGNLLYNPAFPGADPVTFPVRTYRHENGNCAVTGGYVVRDPDLPSLYGRYLYADFCSGWLRSFVPQLNPPAAVGDRREPVTKPQLTTLGEGAARRIYLAQFSGEVWKLVEAP